MFCSKCGSEADENQKFCKSCGNRLLAVPPAIDQGPTTPRQGRNAVSRVANGIGMTGALTLAATVAFGIIVGLTAGIFSITLPAFFGRIIQISVYLAFIEITVGLFLKILGWVMPPETELNRNEQKIQAETPRTNQLESRESPKSIPSVTESTTNLLEDRATKEKVGN
ncbi:MAG TPA: zinc ribbon domain-containing protein [Blastocatellia bacterium]|nr:zinc ribbon domain-containing protein [Blastocatellia bacterium]